MRRPTSTSTPSATPDPEHPNNDKEPGTETETHLTDNNDDKNNVETQSNCSV